MASETEELAELRAAVLLFRDKVIAQQGAIATLHTSLEEAVKVATDALAMFGGTPSQVTTVDAVVRYIDLKRRLASLTGDLK